MAIEGEDIEAAEAHIARARERLTLDAALTNPEAAAATAAFPVGLRWLREDPDAALAEARRVRQELGTWPATFRDALAKELGLLFLALGRPRDAERCFLEISDPESRDERLAHLLFLNGDLDQLKRHLARGGFEYREPFTAVILAASGLVPEAERLLADLEVSGANGHEVQLARIGTALIRGEPASLTSGMRILDEESHALFLVLSDMLAASLHHQGEFDRAIHLLEMTTNHRSTAAFAGTGFVWVKCQLRLADFYRQAGRDALARSIESRLLRLLRNAEDDFPLLRKLTSRG